MGLLTSKLGRFEDRVEDHPKMVQVLAEGDSWFAIRDVKNILRQLKKRYDLNILSLAKSGDEAIEMMTWDQKQKIHDLLEDPENEYDFKLLLFSGGGNDVVGPEMWHLLKEYDAGTMTAPEQCINKKMWNIKKTQIQMTYLELIEIRNNLKPDLDIVAHTYDQAIPNGKAHKFLFFKFGPWMRPSMKKRNIPKKLHQGIVDILLGDMRRMLFDIQKNDPHFHVVDTWGTLQRDQDLWTDELHPTNAGFKKIVTEAWKPILEGVLDRKL